VDNKDTPQRNLTFFFTELIPHMVLVLELNFACIMSVRGRKKAATSKSEMAVKERIRHTKANWFLFFHSFDHKA
jgi:hypothetical protein